MSPLCPSFIAFILQVILSTYQVLNTDGRHSLPEHKSCWKHSREKILIVLSCAFFVLMWEGSLGEEIGHGLHKVGVINVSCFLFHDDFLFYRRYDLAPTNSTLRWMFLSHLFQSSVQHLLENVHHLFRLTAEPNAMSHQMVLGIFNLQSTFTRYYLIWTSHYPSKVDRTIRHFSMPSPWTPFHCSSSPTTFQLIKSKC